MNEQEMKIMVATMLNNRLQAMDNVEHVKRFKDMSTDVFEGVIWSIDERIKELEDTNNETR